MPLVLDRQHVLDAYADAAGRGWVLAAFNSENLTATEAILAAAADHGRSIGRPDLPVAIAVTNLYPERPQTVNYSHTRSWRVGLQLFLADLAVLSGEDSPFADLRVMVHLDHVQPGIDDDLLRWDMSRFSSIMYDAAAMDLAGNIAATAAFVREHGGRIVIEGACDEIATAGGRAKNEPTDPAAAERFYRDSGADLIVANLGTEHRAGAARLQYRGDLARRIAARIGPRLVLHGTSSVTPDQMAGLFADGIRKVNIWTSLERDSSPALLGDMAANAAKVAGPEQAAQLRGRGMLGPKADTESPAALSHFTTHYRQQIVFERMKRIAARYLQLLYRGK